jgi:hypothetical protein
LPWWSPSVAGAGRDDDDVVLFFPALLDRRQLRRLLYSIRRGRGPLINYHVT